jgi:general secretion pathway protein D
MGSNLLKWALVSIFSKKVAHFIKWALNLGILGFSGCSPNQRYHDPLIKRTKAAYRGLTAPIIPSRIVNDPPPYRPPYSLLPPAFYEKVTLSLSGKIPLKQAFFELARQAKVNVILDATFPKKTNFFFTAHEQPLIDVLENLCLIGGLRYTINHNALYVGADRPHLKNHNVQFLLGFRKTQTQTSVKTDIFSDGMQPGQKSLMDNGANITLNTGHTVDFWEELERTIGMVLSTDEVKKKPRYSINRYAGILSVYGTQVQHRQIENYLKQLRQATMTQILVEAKIIEIDLSEDYQNGIDWSVIINKIKDINVANPIAAAGTGLDKASSFLSANLAKEGRSVVLRTDQLEAVVNLMEEFGTVRTLANPRQTVINNQAAVLKVAHNEVFFELQIQDDSFGNNGALSGGYRQRAQSRIQTVPIGLILYVHPSLNWETGDIMVSLHPTISRVHKTVTDPASLLYGSYRPMPGKENSDQRSNRISRSDPLIASSQVPIVQIREMDSVIVAKEGQVIVTGGLMEERVSNNDRGTPGLSSLPGIGALFTHKGKKRQVTELVILLKLTIVRDSNTITPADQRLYTCFTADPRPINLTPEIAPAGTSLRIPSSPSRAP